MARIRPGEGALVAWTAALFGVSQAGQGLGATTADTLFFLRYGVEHLPTMIILSGPVVMGGTLLFTAGLGRLGSRRWLPAALVGAAALLVLERVAIAADLPGTYPTVWLAGQLVVVISFTAMWVAAGEVCTTRQAKRLYPLFASAGIAGGVVGNALTGPLAAALGAEDVLVVQMGLLLGAAALAAWLGRTRFRSGQDTETSSALAELRAGLRATVSDPLLRLMAGVSFGIGALVFLVVFPFSAEVTASFASETEVAGFLGLFSSIATAVTFVVSLVVTNRLFARIGVVATMLVVPLVHAAGFALWLVSFDLTTAAVVRGLQFVAINAVGATAWSSVFNVLPPRRRGRVMAFITAGPMQLGTMMGGLLLLVGDTMPFQAMMAVGSVMALTTAGLVVLMRPAYRTALVEAVRRGMATVFTAPVEGLQKPDLDADARQAVATMMAHPSPTARMMALATLDEMEGAPATSLALPALDDEDHRVRAEALGTIPAAVIPDGVLERLAHDPHPRVREAALEAAADRLPGLAEDALADRAPAVRATAASIVGGERGAAVLTGLLGTSSTDDLVAALDAVSRRPDLPVDGFAQHLEHVDRRVRAAAGRALAARPGGPGRVVPSLDDVSMSVRVSSATALAATPEGVITLMRVLEEGSVRATDAALGALVGAGHGGRRLADWASGEIARAVYLRELREALERRPRMTPAGEYLVRLLRVREQRLERWAIVASSTPETRPTMATVVRAIWSTDEDVRSQALEALDSVSDRSFARRMLVLLEEEGPRSDLDSAAALRILTSDIDPWFRALAFRCVREDVVDDLVDVFESAARDPSPLVRIALSGWEPPTMQESGIVDQIECVLALQAVPIFSGIDPEDLERIADVTVERHYEADELVFTEGDEGDEMLVVLAGEMVAFRRNGDTIVPIRTVGPGEHVGELALLRGRPRSSDVRAGSNGARALALGGNELHVILEERPTVALAMLASLAERLATSG